VGSGNAGGKIVAVVGATGAQGGGLVRAILGDQSEDFVVRAITRDLESPKAQDLARSGAEVVQADLDDFDSVRKAFDGAYAVFCVTFFWAHYSPAKELAQALTMARAAKEAGVHHAIWSTLEDTRRWIPLSDSRMPTLMGQYKVPHFDAKGEANRFFVDQGVPTTFLLTSFYWDNLIHFGLEPKKGPDGRLALTFPMGDKKLPGIAAEDIGRCAYGIFKRGAELTGKTVGISGQHLTGAQMASALSDALGREVRYNSVSPEEYRRFKVPGAEELANMFQFKRDFQDVFCRVRDVAFSRALNPSLQTFAMWLAKNKDCIPLG
jgi:uncharacterized protein YbjT (DUF2867 family)